MVFGELMDEAAAFRLLDEASNDGCNFWDTAEMYPVPQQAATQGRSEEILGAWLSTQPRDKHVVSTKVAGPGGMTWLRGGPVRLDGKNITQAIDASLQRLRTDHIDLVSLHWPDRYATGALRPPRPQGLGGTH